MLTKEERAAVNRNNAKKSTGPKTEAGKAASSRNAIKTGEHATTLSVFVPPHTACQAHEDRQAFYKFFDAHIAKYRPNDEIELGIIRQIADHQWAIDRDAEIETAISNFELLKLIDQVDHPDDDMHSLLVQVGISRALAADPAIKLGMKRLVMLHREIERLERRYFRLKKLCPAATPAVYEATEDKADNLMNTNGEKVELPENEPKVVHVKGPITPRVVKMYQAMNPNRQIHPVPDPSESEDDDAEWPNIA